MSVKLYGATDFTGGTTGCLDRAELDGDLLNNGDPAVLVTASGVYWYRLNATSGAVADGLFRIAPIVNAGDKRWHLVGTTARIGALVYLTADEPISVGTWTNIPWDVAEYNDANFWAPGDSAKFSVPVGVTGVRLSASVAWLYDTNANAMNHRILRNGSAIPGLPSVNVPNKDEGNMSLASSIISVSASDYFTVNVRQWDTASRNIDVVGLGYTWFAIEAVTFA